MLFIKNPKQGLGFLFDQNVFRDEIAIN